MPAIFTKNVHKHCLHACTLAAFCGSDGTLDLYDSAWWGNNTESPKGDDLKNKWKTNSMFFWKTRMATSKKMEDDMKKNNLVFDIND